VANILATPLKSSLGLFVRCQQSGGLHMRTSKLLFAAKKREIFSKIIVRLQGQGERGQVFTILGGRYLWTAPSRRSTEKFLQQSATPLIS